MVQNLSELAQLISSRDNISLHEAKLLIEQCRIDMETAFYNGDLDLVEQILANDLGLEPDYLELFIN